MSQPRNASRRRADTDRARPAPVSGDDRVRVVGSSPVAIGKMIQEARLRAGLSQSALGKLCNMHSTSVCAIENATRCAARLVTLDRIAKALGAELVVEFRF